MQGSPEVDLGIVGAVYALGHEEKHFFGGRRFREPAVGQDIEADSAAREEVDLNSAEGRFEDEVAPGSLGVHQSHVPPPAVPSAVEEPEQSAEELEEESRNFIY